MYADTIGRRLQFMYVDTIGSRLQCMYVCRLHKLGQGMLVR